MYSDNPNNSKANVERDLYNALLQGEGIHCAWNLNEPLAEDKISEDMISVEQNPNARIAYPWDLTEPETDEFFEQSERESVFIGWQSDEINSRSHAFFSRLNTAWATTALQAALAQQFGIRMPQPLLSAIAHQAQEVVSTSRSLAEQLVQCAQAAMSNLTDLAEDDLYVLARPLASTMRSYNSLTSLESALQSVRTAPWEELSEIEQARLSLVVARYALAELDAQSPE